MGAPLPNGCLRLGHSLWLIPREPARTTFQNAIDHHSSEQSTARFRAHVTLIAGVEPEGGAADVLLKAERLAVELKAISARVERIACKNLYFQSVSSCRRCWSLKKYGETHKGQHVGCNLRFQIIDPLP